MVDKSKSNIKKPIKRVRRSKKSIETKEGEVILYPRARKYESSMCETIKEIAQQGGHIAAMCISIGIVVDTFYRWCKEYPEFGLAYDECKLISLARLEHILTKIATGEMKGNFNAVAMLLNNKYRQEYTRTGTDTQINIGSINTIEALDVEELDKKIELLQRKLRLLPKEGKNDDE